MQVFIAILFSYIIGSVPSGFLLTKYVMKKDVRQYGSGNIGATNVARVMGLKAGILVAVAAIAGHDWSIFLGFSGGKGVATTFGVILRLYPLAFLVYALIWILLVFTTRYVSLGSIIGSMSLPIVVYFSGFEMAHVFFAALLSLFVMYTHRENIKRLLKGEENRMDPDKLGKSGKK